MTPLLNLEDLSVAFGGVAAVNRVSFSLEEESVLALVGPNGAGKTTLLNAISGLVRIQGGRITYAGSRQLHSMPAAARAGLGISRTFQQSRLFKGLKVLDQLLCGGYSPVRYRTLASIVRIPDMIHAEKELVRRAFHLLDELGLTNAANLDLESLPGPDRRLVDLGRALMSNPRLLLLDEIAAGMTEKDKERVVQIVQSRYAAGGLAVIVIEHDLQFVRRLAARAVVLASGRVIAAGPTNEVLAQPDVLSAYVGG